MALDESILEELGLGPVWVRRRAAGAAAETAADSTVTQAGAPVPSAAAAVQRAVAPEPMTASPHAAPDEHVDFRDKADKPAQAARTLEPARSREMDDAPPPAEQGAPRFDSPPDVAFDDLPWLDDDPPPPADHAAIAAMAAPDDIRTLDWDALAARVAGCERCRLCERRTNTVFGVGDREADWMLIGEAPGENEDRLGEPFVGQAGKLLDSMLRAVTLARDSNVYIANVIKCRPPGNRNPELDEVARCEPYLQRQVALVKPKLIVALGRFAAQSLLKSEASIASLRGRVHEYEGVPVIVTYHPAYLLRSLPDKAKAWADLCLARDTYRKALDASGVVQGGN
ncbi:Uracil-DNA glycosylase, family 4 [Caballeronia glathei]|uniref:Type-4 uracil-DNA glycosylase n=1 Tax=Caballeronia glathei TaxID=60547 RepID=A0A069PRV0_9BURK|nr:uracil-DNA glycosylase [Caballeronia glathei]KDR43330.1 DNA polymerase [Caballeronia glathei]CDY78761.1 Uracil-DNA glycosylase, family 4 [Caballeronia glathei]